MSGGCDCSGNYFNSLSTTMSTLPSSDYGLMSGSSLGMNSQEFIHGTNPLQNQNQFGQDQNQFNQQNQNPYANNNMGNQLSMNNSNIQQNNALNMQNNMYASQEQPQPPMRPQNNDQIQEQNLAIAKANNAAKQAQANMVAKQAANKKKEVVAQPKCNTSLSKNTMLIVVLLLAGLAWHEVIRYYINRSIKCGEGTHQYYVYYAIAASMLVFFIMSR